MALKGANYRISKVTALVLMTMMLVFIARFFPIKAALLAVLLIFCDKKPMIAKPVRVLCFFLCLSTIWGIIIGVIKGTEDPFQYFFLGMVWPILSLFILCPLLNSEESFRKLFHYLFYIHAFLVLYDIGFALSIIYGFPYYDLYPEVEIGFSFYETSSRMNFANLNVLTYTIPIYFLILLSNYDINVNKILQIVVVVLSFILLILCGRRSLMGLFVFAPIAALFFRRQLPQAMSKNVKYIGFLFIIIIAGSLLYLYNNSQDVFEGYLYQFTKAFDADEEPIKYRQAVLLFNQFLDNPIVGTGSGKFFYDPNRHYFSENYEIIYLLMLATRGIIGFTFYMIGIVGPLLVGFKYARKEKDALFIFMLIAYAYILVAEMTNPIMNGFDLILPLLFNYAKINSLALKRRSD